MNPALHRRPRRRAQACASRATCRFLDAPLVIALTHLIVLAACAPTVHTSRGPAATTGSPNVAALVNASTFLEQSTLVRALLEELGPEGAQDELNHSGLPFTGESHLLVH